LEPKETRCPHCEQDLDQNGSIAKLYHLNCSVDVTLYHRSCPQCDRVYKIDERANGVFIHSAYAVYTYELLRDYLNSFVQGRPSAHSLSHNMNGATLTHLIDPPLPVGRTTFVAFHRKLCLQYAESQYTWVSYESFRKAWNGYVRELQFDEVEAFRCDKCGSSPEVVMFDATLLACRKDFLVPEPASDGDATTLQSGSSHRSRVLLTRAHEKLVRQFARATDESPIATADLADLPEVTRTFLTDTCSVQTTELDKVNPIAAEVE